MSFDDTGEERTARIARLRKEIGRMIEKEYALVVKYREFADSFETLMPDPKLRHDAVLQALSTLIKRERQQVVEAVLGQQEELALLEQAVGGLFTELGVKGSWQGGDTAAEASARSAAVLRHCPKCGERLVLDRYEDRWKCRSCSYVVEQGKSAGVGQVPEKPLAATGEKDLQKKCPLCGGVMNYHVHEERWLCYTCAHEEVTAASAQAGSGEKGGQAKKPQAAPASSFVEPLADMIASESRNSAKGAASTPNRMAAKKTCPVCRKKMDWYEHEKRWRCFFCDHKMR